MHEGRGDDGTGAGDAVQENSHGWSSVYINLRLTHAADTFGTEYKRSNPEVD
jgi:hypothetical protein